MGVFSFLYLHLAISWKSMVATCVCLHYCLYQGVCLFSWFLAVGDTFVIMKWLVQCSFTLLIKVILQSHKSILGIFMVRYEFSRSFTVPDNLCRYLQCKISHTNLSPQYLLKLEDVKRFENIDLLPILEFLPTSPVHYFPNSDPFFLLLPFLNAALYW